MLLVAALAVLLSPVRVPAAPRFEVALEMVDAAGKIVARPVVRVALGKPGRAELKRDDELLTMDALVREASEARCKDVAVTLVRQRRAVDNSYVTRELKARLELCDGTATPIETKELAPKFRVSLVPLTD